MFGEPSRKRSLANRVGWGVSSCPRVSSNQPDPHMYLPGTSSEFVLARYLRQPDHFNVGNRATRIPDLVACPCAGPNRTTSARSSSGRCTAARCRWCWARPTSRNTNRLPSPSSTRRISRLPRWSFPPHTVSMGEQQQQLFVHPSFVLSSRTGVSSLFLFF